MKINFILIYPFLILPVSKPAVSWEFEYEEPNKFKINFREEQEIIKGTIYLDENTELSDIICSIGDYINPSLFLTITNFINFIKPLRNIAIRQTFHYGF